MRSNAALVGRVAGRYLASTGKLVAEYQKAIAALEDGDDSLLVTFMESTIAIIPYGGPRPDWFDALTTVKRNTLTKLYKSMDRLNSAQKQWPDNPQVTPEVRKNWLLHEARTWAKALRTLEIAVAVEWATLEIKHGPFTVVPVPGTSKKIIDAALAALDGVTDKLRAKCPQVLYGKVFLTDKVKKGPGGYYWASHDALYLDPHVDFSMKTRDQIYAIIHELGHRHDAKFLSNGGREKYWALSTRKVHVSTYGASDPVENYAEGFAHFILGMDMPSALAEILADELK